ncbi:YkyB family protein [Bacillus tianshenii]|nr:YkyB family protein [Bacillus tianshenii]
MFTVNRHAKTAPDPKYLYTLKKKSLEKLLKEGKAKKCGLHFSQNPKNSLQRSDLLVSVGDYYFHMPPAKEDFKQLPHLGTANQSYRNPKVRMSLSFAKRLLQAYTGMKPAAPNQNSYFKQPQQRHYEKPVFKKLGDSYF